jgi:DNA-binding NarL/FixJ family response regulator
MRDYIKVCLNEKKERKPFTLKFFKNYKEIIEESKKIYPNLVLTDLHFDNSLSNSLDIAREIKRMIPTCSIYLWSNLIDDEIEEEANNIGIKGLLELPVEEDHLKQIIQKNYKIKS